MLCYTTLSRTQLMYMIMEVSRSYSRCRDRSIAPIAWDNSGTVVVIRDEAELVRQWLPQFFDKSIKLSSFLRKCYRWGFRRLTAKWTGIVTTRATGHRPHPNMYLLRVVRARRAGFHVQHAKHYVRKD